MKDELSKLLDEYRETEKCLVMGLEWLPENEYAKAKLEIVRIIIGDLKKLSNEKLN